MRCRPLRWLWGLLPLALVGFLVLFGERPRIEDDLTSRTKVALEDEGFSFARTGFGGRDGMVTGEAVDEDERTRALDIARKTWGVRNVEDGITLIDEVRPYVWTARLDAKRLRLEGFVPNEAMRKTVLDAARTRFPEAQVEDRMRFARGEPRRTTMADGIRFGFEQLARLSTGEVGLQDLDLTLKGVAATTRDFRAVSDDISRKLPRGIRIALNDVRAPVVDPYTFNVSFSGGKVRLGGFVPDERARSEVLARLKTRFPRATVTDLLETADGALASFSDAARAAIDHLAMLEEGSADFSGANVRFTGRTELEETADGITSGFNRALPGSYRLTHAVTFRKARVPTIDDYGFTATLSDGSLVLEGHVPSEEARRALLAEVRRSMPGVRIADLTELARGEPGGFEDAARTAISHLGRLKSGSAGLTRDSLDFQGRTESELDAEDVAASLKAAMPSGFAVSDRIEFDKAKVRTVDPYSWSASLSQSGIVLEGFVPDEATRAALVSEARRAAPGGKAEDRMEIANGAPGRFTDVARAALRQLGSLRSGEAVLNGEGLDFIGRTETEDEADAVAAELKRVMPSSFTVRDRIEFDKARVRTVDPYSWSASLSESGIVLEGYVPDEATRTALVAEARRQAPGGQVLDRMEIARGEPGDFERITRTAIGALGRLRSGDARLDGNSLSVEGMAMDEATATDVSGRLRSSLSSLITVDDRIEFEKPVIATVRPYLFAAEHADGRLVLEGHVPGEDVRAAIIARAARSMPGVEIVDRMELAIGHPGSAEDWRNATGFAIDQIGALRSGKAFIEDDRYRISGEAIDIAGYDATNAQLKNPPRGLRVVDAAITPPVVENYDWSLSAKGDTIIIEGSVPSEETRRKIFDYATQRFAGRNVIDRMRVAAGVPQPERDWLRAVQTGIRAVSIIGDGNARLYNVELEVTGETHVEAVPGRIESIIRDALASNYSGAANVRYLGPSAEETAAEEARKMAEEERKRLAEEKARKDEEEAARIAAEKAKAEEYRFDVSYDGLQLDLEGTVPSDGDRDTILSTARRKLPDRNVNDKLEVRDGAPAGWVDAILKSFDPLALLEKGRIHLRIGSIKLSGESDSEATLARARRMLEDGLPEGYAAEQEVTYVAPPAPDPDEVAEKEAEAKVDVGSLVRSGRTLDAAECQAVLNSIIRKGKVLFRSSSYDLDAKSRKTLNELPKVAKRCPDMRITIEGHTDSDGAAKYNQWLSERRAEAVVGYLTARGMDESDLSAVGYGEERPIATNDTSANKARNRRIEIDVALR